MFRSIHPTISATPNGCAGCGCDLGGRAAWAVFCPNCGRPMRREQSVGSKLAHLGAAALHCIGVGRHDEPRDARPEPAASRSPMVLGYSNALYTLGWRYERGGGPTSNQPEAVRCYRKSAKLGNLDATVRLAVLSDEIPPKPVISLKSR